MNEYAWVPVLQAITRRLRDFETNQIQLIDWLRQAGVDQGLTDSDGENSFLLEEIDPFSFIGLIMKFGHARRTQILSQLLPLMGLDIKPPTEFAGLPTAHALKAWLFDSKANRSATDIPSLWKLFNETIAGETQPETFDRALRIKQVGMAKLTQYMFYCAPDKILPIDGQTQPYLVKHGISLPEENWTSYQATLDEVRAKFSEPFWVVSHLAWLANQDKSTVTSIWVMRVDANEIGEDPVQDITFDLRKQEQHRKWYKNKVLPALKGPCRLLLLRQGGNSVVCGEARVRSSEIDGDEIRIGVSELKHVNVEVDAKTNHQFLVPGLFTGAVNNHGAARLCREYLDKTRPAYLFTWNPSSSRLGKKESGLLGFKAGQSTRWKGMRESLSVGDPVYIQRVGAGYGPGIIAKARVCSESVQDAPSESSDDVRDDVMIEFESIRDAFEAPGIPLSELEERFPIQEWSPAEAAVEIEQEVREALHNLWSPESVDKTLAQLFSDYVGRHLQAEWISRYRKTIASVARAKESGEVSDDILKLLWFDADNSISSVQQGRISKKNFEALRGELAQITKKIFESPSASTFDAVVAKLGKLKKQRRLSRTPHAITRRVFSAVAPNELTTIVTLSGLKKLNAFLSQHFGMPSFTSDNWFARNVELREFLKEQGVNDSDAAMFNTFCWYLLDNRDRLPGGGTGDETTRTTAMNVILYGPPGTGKTYSLKNDFFPHYTSETDNLGEQEWIDEIIDKLSWYEVIAAAMHDTGRGPVRVKEISEHKFLQTKARLNNRTQGVRQTIWGSLQTHTPDDCAEVRTKARQEPRWFWKDSRSRWRLTDDWLEAGADIVDAVDKINAGPPAGDVTKRYEFVTFHQSYSYEEFVEGIRPTLKQRDVEDGQVSYELSRGIFRRICDKARQDSDGNRYALFIDEINRGNISKIFGELITLLEIDKREGERNELSVRLPYSGDRFSVPSNLDVIGTMNTADRSLAHIDTALRRRFEFRELMPKPDLLSSIDMEGEPVDLTRLLRVLNERIEALFDREHTIGHAYLIGVDANSLPYVFENRILPLLTEYFFEDWSKVRAVLADDQTDDRSKQFVVSEEIDSGLFGSSGVRVRKVYRKNREAFRNPMAYQKIYANIEATEGS